MLPRPSDASAPPPNAASMLSRLISLITLELRTASRIGCRAMILRTEESMMSSSRPSAWFIEPTDS